MEKSVKCKFACDKLVRLLTVLKLTYSNSVSDSECDRIGFETFAICNGPCFRDYFTSKQLIEISNFVRRYPDVCFGLNVIKGDAVIYIGIPFDL